MTLAEISSNEELRRHEFPVVTSKVFLAHAAVCPIPRRVNEAIKRVADFGLSDDQEALLPANFISDTRRLVGSVLHAQPEEIAFVGPTSLGLSYVAGGLPWRRGQNVVIYYDDYPSNVYPWMALAERGVEVRLLNIRELGRLRLIDVQGQVDENTRLVALASCHFISGWRLQVDALGAWLRSRGILFCVDAIQTVGAFPTTVENVDFLAADAHKWLLGPCAAGILYVRKELQAHLRPMVHGWHNIRCPNFITQEDLEYKNDARRYEAGSQNLLGLAGLREAFLMLEEIGAENIGKDLVAKRSWLIQQLQSKGAEILLSQMPAENVGGITSFALPGVDSRVLHQQLADAGIVVSLRTSRDGRNWIRLSPHYYNTYGELNRFLEALP
jgi:selenocysteine lyase/cysteine desulfurase